MWAAVCFFSGLCWLVTTKAESVGKGKVTSFWSYDTKKGKIFGVWVWEGTSGWAHRSAVSSYLLCHADGSVSETQTLLLQHTWKKSRLFHSKQSEDSLLRYYMEISWFNDVLSHCIFMTLAWFSRPLRVKHKCHRHEEHHQHSFWLNAAWTCELFWFFEEHVVQFFFIYIK